MRFLSLALCLACLTGVEVAQARVPAAHAWQRDIRRDSRPTRLERKRFRWGGNQDQQVTVQQVERQIQALSKKHPGQLKVSVMGHVKDGIGSRSKTLPLYRVDLGSGKSKGPKGKRPLRVLIAGGVHGNEPTGVRTAMAFVDKALRDKGLRDGSFQITVLPMVNPTGCKALTRFNSQGKDVNRSWCKGKWTPEARAVKRSLKGQSYDLFIDLHGANKPGFFAFRAANDGNLSGRILSAMHGETLLDVNRWAPKGDRFAAGYYLHALGAVESTRWRREMPPKHKLLIGAARASSGDSGRDFEKFMHDRGTPYCYTLEYPRRLAPQRQVQGMLKLLRSTLHNVARHGSF
jgi:hypothetical protein